MTEVAGAADHKTAAQWAREGRRIKKGSKAELYLVNDDRTSARGLFHRRQTEPAGEPDESDSWTVVIPAAEWEQIKSEAALIRRRPRVKIRKVEGGGVDIWCGPDRDIIQLLRYHGYIFMPATRYWRHHNKDPEMVAAAFERGKIRDQRVRVDRDWLRAEGMEV
jgi:hypothetical protein